MKTATVMTTSQADRQIKFRAWVHDTMYEDVFFTKVNNRLYDLYQIINGVLSHVCLCDKDTLQLMQFTGLLDKNGKEIYDKDILRFVGGTCQVLPCGNYGEHHIVGAMLIVKWLPSGWTLCPKTTIDADIPNLVGNVGNYDLWNHHRSFERVGNVYENSNLLQG